MRERERGWGFVEMGEGGGRRREGGREMYFFDAKVLLLLCGEPLAG